MSGFAGVLAPDGASVDPFCVQRLAEGLTYFAPDGAAVRVLGGVGLGYAEARYRRDESEPERGVAMPASDDSGSWVVADALLVERDRLVRELGAAGVRADADAPVSRLLLAAYRAWGTHCVEHLHGDFAFAVWDASRRRLLLARDRFGLRPLYYAKAGSTLVFANALDVVRLYPGVRTTLDDAAVGDFLHLGHNSDPEATVFADVACVPPAHTAVVTADGIRLSRYWSLPTGAPLPYRRIEEYAEQFTSVFGDAVADRIRGLDDAALFLSGGRDSTSVAAMARARAPAGLRLHAITGVYDYAMPDEERNFAALAAAALSVPVEFVAQDEFGWFEDWERPDLWRPEPMDAALLAGEAHLAARAAARARVALTGEGGDGALRERESHLARLLFSGRWVRALSESLAYVRLHRRIPRPGFRRLRVRRRGVPNADYAPAPWIRPEFIERVGLRDRWRALELADRLPDETEVRRPEAYAKLQSVFWQRCAESDHPSSTGIALELRHTYFDERVVNFLLSLPSEQWANDKGIVVAAMRGHLPNRVRLRRKTPLVGDSYDAAFQVGGSPRPNLEHFDELARTYIDPAALPAGGSDTDPDNPWDWTRAYSLALWLKRLGSDGGRSRTATARADVQLAP